jgi:Ca-activated chloride channel family protein
MQLFGLGLLPLLSLLAVAAASTVALYLLRLRRRRVTVPFIPLWEGLLSERQSSRLFSRLRHVVSLLIALLIVALLVLSLGDPRPRAESSAARHMVLLIDAGATMQARDVAPDRAHVARDHARRIVKSAGADLQIIVAQMDANTTPLSTLGAERRTLEQAVDQVETTDLATDYQRAYRFALDVLRGRSRPEIAIVSDSPQAPEPALAAAMQRAGVRLSYEPVGRRGRNVAITQFALRRYPLDKNRSELLVELASASQQTENVELTLLGDGAPVDVQQLTLAPGQTIRRVYDDVTGVDRRLEARVALARDHDDLAVDDRAYAVLPERRRSRVLCVSAGDRYLEAALLLDEYLDVDIVAPPAYRTAAGYDAVIFDRFVPPTAPAAPAFFIDPEGGGAANPLDISGRIERPFFDKLERSHPILRFTSLRDVNVASALHVRPAAGDVVLGADARGPLLIAGERAGQRFVALTFDPDQSDLPLRVAWPLLVLNVIDWFTADAHDYLSSSSVGELLDVALPDGIDRARVSFPDGRETELPASAGHIVLTPARSGFYRVAWNGGERWAAVNLSSATRRDLKPLAQLAVPALPVRRAELGSPGLARLPWALMLAFALLLLTAEWATYNRRWTV